MKNLKQIYIAIILLVFLASCNEQNATGQLTENKNNKETVLPENVPGIQEVDTIWTANAPSRITRKIRKDKEGNLLFAAYEDIIRYEDSSFTNFTKEAGLDSYDAFDVWEDKNRSIWIASTHLGVFQYPASDEFKIDGKTFTHFTTKNGLIHNRAMCIYEDMAGGIWIGTEGGISYYDGESRTNKPFTFRNFTIKEGLTNGSINTIMEDKVGNIWVGTRGALSIYSPLENLDQDEKPFKEITTNEGETFENICSILEDKNGNIWLGGQHGLWCYNGISFTKLTTMNVISIYEDKKGYVWFTHNSPSGLSRIAPTSILKSDPKPTLIFKSPEMLFGLTEDKNSAIWIGDLYGVFRYDGKSVTYFRDEQSRSK